MADVTIIPPSQVANVSSLGQQAADGGTHPPGLTQGSLVSGTIAGRDAGGNYLLKTSQGTFTLQSSTPLTYNSDVTVRIGANTAGSTSARIVSVNGESFSDFAAPQAEEADSVSATLLAQGPQTASGEAPSTPQAVQAVVTSAPAQPASAPQPIASTQLVPGSAVVVRIDQGGTGAAPQAAPQTQAQAAQPPSPAVTSAAVAVEPEQVAQNPQTATAPQPVLPSAPQQPAANTSPSPIVSSVAPAVETLLSSAQAVTQAAQDQAPQDQSPQPQAGQTAAAAGTQPQPQVTPQSAASASAAQYGVYSKQSAIPPAPAAQPPTSTAATIPAQVVSTDENGNIALQTALGTVSVKATGLPALSAFTPGANVTLELLPSVAAQVLAEAPAALSELASTWQSLKDILTVVNAANPDAAQALTARLPQLGTDFAAQSTAFMAAVVQGDARRLLGDDTIDALRDNGRGDLEEKFSGELADLSAAFTAPPQRQMPGWQMMLLPFVYQEAIQQARIYVKRNPQKKERTPSKQETADTRFVVEVDLTELGPMQMDGLVRKKEQATAFDLVIRSHTPFSSAAQSEITGIYNGAAQLTGFKGSISFQVTRDFPVKPLDEAAKDAPHSFTV